MLKRLSDEAINKAWRGKGSILNGCRAVAQEAQKNCLRQVVDMIDRRIAIYMSDAGVKMGYGLAYQVLSELRQELKKQAEESK